MSSEDSKAESLRAKTDAFLHDFFEKGEELVRELIRENEFLRSQLDTAGPEVAPAPTGLARDTVEELVRRVATLERECEEIRKLAGAVQHDSGYRARLESLEQEHYNLACMYVAGMQFHTAGTIEEVLRTITEILLNFVGVGSFTIFGVDEERQRLFPVAREGGEVRQVDELDLDGHASLRAMAALQRAWRAGDAHHRVAEEMLFLPLVSGTRLVGATRLDSFLSQKKEFVDSDAPLLSLISEHAGVGIETAWIRAHAKEVPLQRQAIEELVGA